MLLLFLGALSKHKKTKETNSEKIKTYFHIEIDKINHWRVHILYNFYTGNSKFEIPIILVLWNIKKYVIESEIQKLKWLKYNSIKKINKKNWKMSNILQLQFIQPSIFFHRKYNAGWTKSLKLQFVTGWHEYWYYRVF